MHTRCSTLSKNRSVCAAISIAWSVSVVLAVAGCAAGPDFNATQPQAPQDWTQWRSLMPELHAAAGGENAISPEQGWSVYDDAVLRQFQQMALAGNADLRTAALNYAQSVLQRRIAGSDYGPDLDLQAGISRSRLSESSAATRVAQALPTGIGQNALHVLSEPYTLRQAGFDASWEPDLWGRVRRSVEASSADVAASSALLDDAQLSILSEVARNYFEWRALASQIDLAGRQIGNAQTRLALVRARNARGLIDNSPVATRQATLAVLQASLPGLEARQAAALNQLAILLERRPVEIEPLLSSTQGQSVVALPDLSAGLPSELARRRPDIAASEARLHAATARVGIAVADLYPRITLGGNLGYESTIGPKFGDWGSRTWSVGASLDLPIFDMGRRRTTVGLRDLQAQEAAVAYQHTVLSAWQDLDDALSRYGAERLRNGASRQRVESTAKVYRLAIARHARGQTNQIAVLDAEQDYLVAEQDLAVSDGALRQSLAVVIKAAGGGLGRMSEVGDQSRLATDPPARKNDHP